MVCSAGARAQWAARRRWTAKAVGSSAAAISMTARPGSATWAAWIGFMLGTTGRGPRPVLGPRSFHPAGEQAVICVDGAGVWAVVRREAGRRVVGPEPVAECREGAR